MYMDYYQHFSKVYDLFISNYDWCFGFIEEAIREHAHNPRTLLELACGTGNILQHFASSYEVSGLDVSVSMLEQARKKLPDVPLFQMDMAAFNLDRKYDIVLCMFDSLNHLIEYEQWTKTFRCVRNHLTSAGVFLFDINTMERLDRLAQIPGLVEEKGDLYLIMRVTKASQNVANWNVKIFRLVKDNLYEFSEDNIQEASFSLDRIISDLEKSFSKVHVHTIEGGPNTLKGRVFFVCQV